MLGTDRGGKASKPSGSLDMEQLEALPAALIEDADRGHHRARPLHRGGQDLFVAEAAIDERDLTDIAHRLQELRLARMTADHGDNGAALGQPLHDVAADEPRPADHADTAIAHQTAPFRSLAPI